jgi:hypothetical protein
MTRDSGSGRASSLTGRFHVGQPVGLDSGSTRRIARSGTSLSFGPMRNRPCDSIRPES